MKTLEERCALCRYFRPGQVAEGPGQCRAEPPKHGVATGKSYWPPVPEDGWCGSFRPGQAVALSLLVSDVAKAKGWSVRVVNVLAALDLLGETTIAEFRDSRDAVLSAKGFGATSRAEVERTLDELGASW